ncbi:MAG: hypothetical protein LBT52_04145, partial [Clostridiales Family XIII bacterium]|nr:hypothetical protein [Clostridiales Family XIII bacterium]
ATDSETAEDAATQEPGASDKIAEGAEAQEPGASDKTAEDAATQEPGASDKIAEGAEAQEPGANDKIAGDAAAQEPGAKDEAAEGAATQTTNPGAKAKTAPAAAPAATVSVSTEAQLSAALASASTNSADPTLINITANITLTYAIELPAGKFATLRGSGGARTLTMGQNVAGAQKSDTYAVIMSYGGAVVENLTINAGGYMRAATVMPGGFLTLNSGAVIRNGKLGAQAETGGAGVRVQGVSAASYGTFVMNPGSSVTGCRSAGTYSVQGVGVYVGRFSRFTMNGGSISDNTDPNDRFKALGGGVYVYNFGGYCHIAGGEIRENSAYGGGGGVYVAAGTSDISGGNISGNASAYGGGVYSNGTVTFTGGTISGNEAVSSAVPTNTSPADRACGGGVFVASGTFTMSGGASIRDNAAVFKMSANTGAYNVGQGGGVYARAVFTMNGGTISDNTAATTSGQAAPAGCGGGVAVGGGSTPGTFGFTGGTIVGNSVQNKGGGVYQNAGENVLGLNVATPTFVPGGGVLRLSGAPVCTGNANMAEGDDNIYLPADVTLGVAGEMGDAAALFVGSEVAEPGTVIGLPDGAYEISPLDATAFSDNDGGKTIALENGALVKGLPHMGPTTPIAGAFVFPIPDAAYTGARITPVPVVSLGGIILVQGTDYLVSYRDNLDVGAASAIITGIGAYEGRVTETFGITPCNLSGVAASPIADRVYAGQPLTPRLRLYNGGVALNEGTDYVTAYEDNTAVGTARVTASAVNGGNYTGALGATFEIISSVGVNMASDADGLRAAVYGAGGTPSVPEDIYTTDNIVVSGVIEVPQGVYVRLIGNSDDTSVSCAGGIATGNGFVMVGGGLTLDNIAVDAASFGRAAFVSPGGILTLADGGVLTRGMAMDGSGVYNLGELNVSGGQITDCAKTVNTPLNTGRGGGVYNGGGADMILTAGEISDNFSSLGGGVYNAGAFMMTGGTIEDNAAMGSPSNFVSGEGGGVYSTGTAIISGGAITDNTATDFGGGVANKGTLTLLSGAVSRNSASGNGGGIYTSGSLAMSGGDIADNAVRNAEIVFTPSIISGCGGGVFIAGGGFEMSGGAIRGNTASSNYISAVYYAGLGCGGGVYISNNRANHCTFTMSGGSVTGNAARCYNKGLERGCGGGVYAAGGDSSGVGLYPASFEMTGGEVTGNAASDKGAGVFMNDRIRSGDPASSIYVDTFGASALKLGGAIRIAGNGSAGNLWFTEETSAETNTGITSTPASIGVSSESGGDAPVLYGSGGYNIVPADAAAFVSERGRRSIELDAAERAVVLRAIDIAGAYAASLDRASFTYTGGSQRPAVTLVPTGSAGALKAGEDYTVSFGSNTTDKGQKTVRVDGKGDFKGSVSATYEIFPKQLDQASVVISSVSWTGKQAKPVSEISVTDESRRLLRGTDYTIAGYGTNIGPGAGTVTLAGKGNYTGTRPVRFTILKEVSALSVSDIADAAYTGKALTPRPTIKDGGSVLKEGVHYALAYTDNIKTGEAKVTITGKTPYRGTRQTTFRIIPKKLKISKLAKAGKGKIKISWKKDAGASGYQALIALDKKFKKGKKTATATSYKTVSKTFKKLKSGKTYYAKIRAYKLIGGKKRYGQYSAVKKIRVK